MSRYIDEDKLYSNIEEKYKVAQGDAREAYNDVLDTICEIPTADVQEVRHAKWIYCGHHEFHGHVFECSVCGRYLFANSKEDVYWEYPYCHCGAKMESVEGLEED